VGTEELLAALRNEGEKKAGVLREEAESAAARLRGEAVERLALLRENCARERAAATAAEQRAAGSEAARAARGIRLEGAQKMAQRLQTLARALLPRLRDAQYPELFARLAGELPPREWVTLRVNPADLDRARVLFPGAQLVPDGTISGGLEACARGGELVVVNTLEKRLERGWPELLPVLFKEVENSA
jgi:V/A-type H+/Na+-transporting ATPase subunit E